ncbi:hypothetical protein CHU95_14565 [Niveispirillum lacus]|uniref:Uncharacterized protein n=1 Tax=Niveispirillum lacus TaxID=1981099 RepID=A0A255YWM2_9PROT|nr:hypothetical protein CHU95_14565 [Niveispirillum lacus]
MSFCGDQNRWVLITGPSHHHPDRLAWQRRISGAAAALSDQETPVLLAQTERPTAMRILS